MRFVVMLLWLALIAAAAAHATVGRSGLSGIVTRGPITPVCVAEQPCSEPAAGAALVFSRNGHEVARTRVRQDGSYRIALPAATYAVKPASRRPMDPPTVRVRSGRVGHVDFAIDTGIR